MRRIWTFGILLVMLVFLISGCGGPGGSGSSSGDDPVKEQGASGTAKAGSKGLRKVTIAASGGETVKLRVEIADSSAEQQRGLMDRTALGKNRGMLFVFEGEQPRSFWMKNTLIPLSIAYIDSGGRIVDLQEMKALDDEPPHYVSAEPAKYALEANKGFFADHGVEVGDPAKLPG